MKLHLPVTLLRAVMALFASQVALTSAWAEETEATNPTTITHAVTENTVYLYGSGDENWQDAWREEWSADEIIITSGNQQKHDVTFKSDGAVTGYNCVMDASKLTISNLGNVTIDGFQGNSSNTAIISAVEYNIINNDSFNYINNNGVVFTEPGNDYSIMRFEDNGEINITGNSAYLEGYFTLGTAIEDIKDVLITGTKRDITMSYNRVESGQEWVSGSAVRLEGKLTFAGNQGNIDVSHNTGRIMSGHSGDAHGGAILAFGVEITGTGGDISFNDNAVYTEGRDYAGGGAISSVGAEDIEVDGVLVGVKLLGNITLSDNLGNIEFNSNKVQSGSKAAYDTDMLQVAAGGAMVAQGKVEISGNKGNLIGFNSNRVEAEYNSAGGGAIAVMGAVEITENKADVEALTAEDENAGNKLEFKNNSVSSLSDSVCGGAIYSSNDELISAAQDKLGIDYATAEILVDQLVPTYVSIDNNGDVSFIDNSITSGEVDADGKAVRYGDFADGGAIYSEGEVSLSNDADVEFSGNNATSVGSSVRGGAVYSEASVDISGNAAVTFDSNVAKSLQIKSEYGDYYYSGSAYGGAIHMNGSNEDDGVAINNNGVVSFTGNEVTSDRGSAHGGAIYSNNEVAINGNTGGVLFDGNKTHTGIVDAEGNLVVKGYSADGGAIYADGNVDISGNSEVTFRNNEAFSTDGSAWGAGIYSSADVLLSGNGNVTFINNSSTSVEGYSRGAAIISNNRNGVITIEKNADVLFESNTVESATDGMSARGGAISTANQLKEEGDTGNFVYLRDNKSITFRNNASSSRDCTAYGGGVHVYGQLIISGNGSGTFIDNGAHSGNNSEVMGGALYSEFGATISGNGDLNFDSNSISSKGGNVSGAAIGANAGNIIFTGNDSISFTDNSVSAVGSFYKETVEVDAAGNETKRQEKVYNQLSSGGAMAANSSVILDENKGDIVFRGNSVTEIATDAVLPFGEYSGRDEDTTLLPDLVGGGAIAVAESILLRQNKGNVSFSENMVNTECKSVYGGALAAVGGYIDISGNTGNPETVGSLTLPDGSSLTYGTVNFSQNSVSTTANGCDARGGAIATFTDSYGGGQVVITGNDTVTFYYNSVSAKDGSTYGGSIYAANDVILSGNGAVSFGNNGVIAGTVDSEDVADYDRYGNNAYGGAIYSAGDVTLSSNDKVSFTDNSAKGYEVHGGAIYSAGEVLISSNKGTHADEPAVNISGNTIICADDGFGGAIYAGQKSGNSISGQEFKNHVTLDGNGNIVFDNNKIVSDFRARGGAIYADGYITLSGNGDVTFTGNSVKSDHGGSAVGGAISTYLVMGSDSSEDVHTSVPVGVSLSGNGAITFSGNSSTAGRASANGGAIHSAGKVVITGNSGDILFSHNTNEAEKAYSAAGGAIAGYNGVDISGNTGESIKFEGNQNKSNGGNSGAGALYARYNDVSITGNEGVAIEFKGNSVEGVGRFVEKHSDGSETEVNVAAIAGGAIGADDSSVLIKNNGAVSFTDNKVIDKDAEPGTWLDSDDVDVEAIAPGLNVTGGGAIMSVANIEISGNAGVTISGNSATSDSRRAMGGAIGALGSASISHNKGDVNVSGNYAASKTGTAMGGAIFAQNGLSIVNNEGNVTFSGNYVKNGDNHQLNSVVVQGGKVELAAEEGKSISFYDSVLVGAGSEVVLNSYTDASGQKQTSSGAIVFSGANAVETLQQLKGEGGTVSAGEISASLTSQINREVSVAGGSLQVKDGAVLRMQSLVVNNGADLLIGAGSTVAVDSTVTFEAGSEYTVLGLKAATTLKLGEVASSTPTAQIAGNIALTAGMTYTMDGAYTELVGPANTLAFEGSGTYTFNVDESVAYTEGTTKYFVLFTGVDTLTGAELSTGVDPTLLSGIEFLTNIGYYDDIMLHYLNHETAGGVLYISATVPEPTTATLSLLALAALAARRRRK